MGQSEAQKLDIKTDIANLAIKLAEDILAGENEKVKCNSKTCEAPLQTCVETLSLIRGDKLDDFEQYFEKFIPIDFTMTNDHCTYKTTGGRVKLEKKPKCFDYITALGPALNIPVNVSRLETNFRLLVTNSQLTYLQMDQQLETRATCSVTPALLSLQLLDSELAVMLLKAKHSCDGLLKLLGMPTISEAIAVCKDSVLEQNSLLECVENKLENPSSTRSKRFSRIRQYCKPKQ